MNTLLRRRVLAGTLSLLALGAPLPAPAQGPDAALPGAVESREAGTCGGRDITAELAADGRLAAVEAKARAVPNGEGKLFRIEKAGLPASYLFGTMHLTDPRVQALPPQAEAAFAGADTLVIETLDVLDPAKSAAAMFAKPDLTYLPPGQTLADLLDPEEEALVRTALDKKGVPFTAVERLQPWFVGASLMLPPCEAERAQGGATVLDVTLAHRAGADKKAVKGLESATEQLEAMASLPIDIQVESLVSTLAFADRLPDVLETMVNLYLDGKIAEITPVVEAAMPESASGLGSGEAYAAFEERIVTVRNKTMIERVEPILADGDVFVAVGSLHLPGPEGLVELLRADGWTVTRAD